jgi:hypothetical protein
MSHLTAMVTWWAGLSIDLVKTRRRFFFEPREVGLVFAQGHIKPAQKMFNGGRKGNLIVSKINIAFYDMIYNLP